MKIYKRLLIVLLVIAVVLLTACGKNSNNDSGNSNGNKASASKDNTITMLYSSSDTFNPYTAVTENNRQLCKLIYDSLIKLDNKFEVVKSLAKNITLDGRTCTVTINDKIFSDGSAVTAEDVAYSYSLAKNSATEYGYKLYEVASVSVIDSKTVCFNLTRTDPFFVNLIDFPILKKGSEQNYNSDSVLLPPTGSGRYKVNDTRDGLELNTKSVGDKAQIKKINLINAPDDESVAHYVEIGAVDIFYGDISVENIPRMSGKKSDINLNRLVYIGVNKNYGALAQNQLRQAISSGINRTQICRDGFYNNAVAATGFFHPVWKPVKSVQNIQTEAKSEITIENLEKIGYNNLNSDNIRINSSGKKLTFELLVNSENRARVTVARLIATQLSTYGIKVNVVEKSFSDYYKALTSGNFQLYLGEVEITPNMDMTNLVVRGGSAAYGIVTSGDDVMGQASLENLIGGFYSGSNNITDIASVLQSEMPFIPVCYRTGSVFYNERIDNVSNSSAGDIYFSIESYKLNNN